MTAPLAELHEPSHPTVNHAAPFDHAHLLLAQLHQTPPSERWALPFPLAVFGTLRQGFDNHHLLQRGPIAHHCRAFLPHFFARGIKLFFRNGSSAPFEIFVYGSEAWHAIMPPIEELEQFIPSRMRDAGYHRTLAWLCLLPDDYQHPAFESALPAERDLRIEPGQWMQYERVPCWIYSSLQRNRRAAGVAGSPIIWDGVIGTAQEGT